MVFETMIKYYFHITVKHGYSEHAYNELMLAAK